MQPRRDWTIDELKADETPGGEMLCQERCSIDFGSGVDRCLQWPGRTQRGREAPRRFFEARDLDTGGAALDEKPDRTGVEVDCRHRVVVLRQNRPPDRIDRMIHLNESDRGMWQESDAVAVRRRDRAEAREVERLHIRRMERAVDRPFEPGHAREIRKRAGRREARKEFGEPFAIGIEIGAAALPR